MSPNSHELYQQVILEHNRSPKNFHKLDPATHAAEGYNPLCGDHINIYLHMNSGMVKDISFDGSGCAISTASASILTVEIKGKLLSEVERIVQDVHHVILGSKNPEDCTELSRSVSVFAGIRQFPARVKCATLPWHTLKAALEGKEQASTE